MRSDAGAQSGAQPRTGSGARSGSPSPMARLARAARRRVLARIPRLTEAAGESGVAFGPVAAAPQHPGAPTGRDVPASPVRLGLLGDSAAAGVGARTHDEALAGWLGRALAERTGRTVRWRVSAENGATARRVRTALVRDLAAPGEPWRPDLVLLVVGVNDLLRWSPMRVWRADLLELIREIRARTGNAALAVSAVPPVQRFPAVPRWLRPAAAYRVRAMNRVLLDVARAEKVAVAGPDPTGISFPFAEDGFHLGPDGYRLWAELIAGDLVALVPADSMGA